MNDSESKTSKGSLYYRRIVSVVSLLVMAVAAVTMVMILAAPERGHTAYDTDGAFDNISTIHLVSKIFPYTYTVWMMGLSFQSSIVLLVFTIFLRRERLATGHLLCIMGLIGVILFKLISTSFDFVNWEIEAKAYTPEGRQYVIISSWGIGGPGRPVYLCRATGWDEDVRHFEVMAISGLDNHFVTNLVRPERVMRELKNTRLEIAFSSDRKLMVGLDGRECFMAWRFDDDTEKRNLAKDDLYKKLSPFCLFGPDDTIHIEDLEFLKQYVADPRTIQNNALERPYHPDISALEQDRDSHPNSEVRAAASELLEIIRATHPAE